MDANGVASGVASAAASALRQKHTQPTHNPRTQTAGRSSPFIGGLARRSNLAGHRAEQFATKGSSLKGARRPDATTNREGDREGCLLGDGLKHHDVLAGVMNHASADYPADVMPSKTSKKSVPFSADYNVLPFRDATSPIGGRGGVHTSSSLDESDIGPLAAGRGVAVAQRRRRHCGRVG